MRYSPTALLPALALAGALGAQNPQNTATFPGDHAGVPGFTWQQSFPFSNGIARQMMLYESWDIDIPNGKQITHLGFRREETNLSSTGVAIQLEISMGPSVLDASTADRDYAKNYSSPPSVVFTKKIFNLPNLGAAANDVVWVPLDTPHTFDSSKNLVVDYKVFANQAGNAAFAYRLDLATFSSPVVAHGVSCQTSGGKTPKLESSASKIGGSWAIRLTNGSSSSNTVLLVGWRPIASPISLTPIQMPGCWINVNLAGAVSIPGTTGTTGSLTFRTPIPNNLSLYKGKLYSMAIMDDLFANPLGKITTNGDEMRLGVDPRQTAIRSTGDPLATRGSLTRNWGAVSLFGWQ